MPRWWWCGCGLGNSRFSWDCISVAVQPIRARPEENPRKFFVIFTSGFGKTGGNLLFPNTHEKIPMGNSQEIYSQKFPMIFLCAKQSLRQESTCCFPIQ